MHPQHAAKQTVMRSRLPPTPTTILQQLLACCLFTHDRLQALCLLLQRMRWIASMMTEQSQIIKERTHKCLCTPELSGVSGEQPQQAPKQPANHSWHSHAPSLYYNRSWEMLEKWDIPAACLFKACVKSWYYVAASAHHEKQVQRYSDSGLQVGK